MKIDDDNEIKREFGEKLTDSENEIDENFNFDDLYEKVFEDINSDQQETGTSKVKGIKFKRRRGRPRLNHPDNEDDPDILYDELEYYENKPIIKKRPQNKQEESTSETVAAKSNANGKPQRKRGPPIKYAVTGPPFQCEICNILCKSRLLLNSHRFRKHRPQEDPQFSCTKCDRMFQTKQSLDRHMRRPTCDAYPQFECEHCGKKCIGLSNYNIHLRFHKRQYPFVCHLCGKKFMMRVHLNEHVMVKHENKRYPCEHPGCGKQFQTRNSLYNHSYQHTGVMPYECEYCKRGYASKSRLRFHCKKSHSIDHTIDELDRMQVTEKLPKVIVKAQEINSTTC